MIVARTRVTAQGQVSVPSEVRKQLGIGTGSVLEWEVQDGRITVQRVGSFSSKDVHRAFFGSKTPEPKSLDELKEGLRDRFRKRYARR